MYAVLTYVLNMLPFMLLAAPLYALLRFLRIKKRRAGFRRARELLLFLFFLFLVGLASQTIVPRLELTPQGLGILRQGGGLNLVPFRVFPQTFGIAAGGLRTRYFLINFLGNILIFIPLGLCPPLLWKSFGWKKTLLLGFLCTLAIELCQYPLGRGTDVDDLWLNTLGTLLGWGIFVLLRRAAPRAARRFLETRDAE